MINTASNFQSALAYVMTEPDPLSVSFEGDMRAAAFNAAFQNIEDQINFLYEKTRLLEDIRDYIRHFVERVIEERRAKIIDNLKAIEMIYDEIDNPDCVVEPVVPQQEQTVQDRDGSILPMFDFINETLVMPGTTLKKNDILKITVKEQTQDYSNEKTVYDSAGIVEPLVQASVTVSDNTTTFIDTYTSHKPIEGSITTTYEIFFSGSIECNYVNLPATNCDVLNITLYDIDNNFHFVTSSTAYVKPIRVVRALVTLRTKGYNRYTVRYPVTKTMPDSFTYPAGGQESYVTV